MIIFAIIRLQKLELSEYKSCMLKVGKYCNYPTAIFRTLRLQTMHVKNAKKASSKLQRMQTTLSRNYCSINAPKLSAVIHCLQWMTAKIALKLQWEIEHSGNLQNLQGNYLQCTYYWRDSFEKITWCNCKSLPNCLNFSRDGEA